MQAAAAPVTADDIDALGSDVDTAVASGNARAVGSSVRSLSSANAELSGQRGSAKATAVQPDGAGAKASAASVPGPEAEAAAVEQAESAMAQMEGLLASQGAAVSVEDALTLATSGEQAGRAATSGGSRAGRQGPLCRDACRSGGMPVCQVGRGETGLFSTRPATAAMVLPLPFCLAAQTLLTATPVVTEALAQSATNVSALLLTWPTAFLSCCRIPPPNSLLFFSARTTAVLGCM